MKWISFFLRLSYNKSNIIKVKTKVSYNFKDFLITKKTKK